MDGLGNIKQPYLETVQPLSNGVFKNKLAVRVHLAYSIYLIPESALMAIPAHRFAFNRPNSTARQTENIAVTEGPTVFRLHLFQCPARETASCGGLCEKLKGNFSCPANLTPLPRMNQNANTWLNKRKVGEEERVDEKMKPAVWKRLVFTPAQRRMLICTLKFGHNQTLNLSLRECEMQSAKVDFSGEGGSSQAAGCAFKIYMRCS